MSEYTTSDLLQHAIDKKPLEFETALDDILKHKLADRIDAYKQELAGSIYGSSEDDNDEEYENDFEYDDENEDYTPESEDLDDQDSQ